ncbi:hypothetical protein DAI22_11g170900 [Oryza sativa Japonica Group]|nr:receptor kinase-like protein Xa21 isoform X2 [Oryza sativa Japonica Group]KAF2911341.1 hypothetical protein DAI22_11g170900 [Oryza sativa Japonica Group]
MKQLFLPIIPISPCFHSNLLCSIFFFLNSYSALSLSPKILPKFLTVCGAIPVNTTGLIIMARATALLCSSLLLLSCFYAQVSPGSSSSSRSTAMADEPALLSFKSMLLSDGFLASWNASSHYCSWPGVVCGGRHPERVVALQMSSFNLSGRISPSLGNLSLLRELELGDNQFTGDIPPEIGQLTRLRMLNLSSNYLQGSIPASIGECAELMSIDLGNNQLQGEIPAELGALKNLVRLGLHENALSGEIPRSLADLQSLGALSLFKNRLHGEIPPGLGNLTNLYHLLLAHNMLSGAIPSSLGMLSGLSWLELGFNNLTGLIPSSIWNVSSLTELNLQQNMLHGTMPPDVFNSLPHLQHLYINDNQFHGNIPVSIGNVSALSRIQIGFNSFGGIIPPEVGRLRNLTSLEAEHTFLEAKDQKGWGFISALTNCSKLQALFLGNNRFEGVLPVSISNLSVYLEYLYLDFNAISGSLPEEIGNLVRLEALLLHNNSFTGILPSSLGRLKNLQVLYIDNNKISGSIPLAIGNLTELNYFRLDVNAFTGRIPSALGNLTNLVELGLSSNNFTGSIPVEIFKIHTLSLTLDISNNNLEGSIPQEIGGLKNLVQFYADSNKLSGEIPSTLGECQLLQNISLQNNFLSGSVPSLLSQLKGLQILDLSNNNLSGQIPTFLSNLTMLSYLNLSFNDFSGEVPTFGVFSNPSAISIHGNGKLCGGIPDLHLPRCSSQSPHRRQKLLVIPIVVSLAVTLLLLLLLYKLLYWRKNIKTNIPSTTSMEGHPLISHSQLVRATDNFSATNLLGSGSFGSVYKGEINNQAGESKDIAVKVLKLQTPGALKSFIAECEALRNLWHRNLVKIITACSSIDNSGNDFKAIVFEFMPNGSLDGWLHPDNNDHTEQRYLNILERVSILLDVAYALDYLHCHGPAPVIHCDIKSSNVLLDSDMVARVGDFGLARILDEQNSVFQPSTNSILFRGTIGYAAPGSIFSVSVGLGLIASGPTKSTASRPTHVAYRYSSRHAVARCGETLRRPLLPPLTCLSVPPPLLYSTSASWFAIVAFCPLRVAFRARPISPEPLRKT